MIISTFSDWLISMASQTVQGYFMPRSYGIAYIIYPYLHFFV